MRVGTEELYRETLESLERIQQFDVNRLPRVEELGSQLNFSDAVEPAQILVDLYSRLSTSALQDFPDPALTAVKNSANASFKIFQDILDFTVKTATPQVARDNHVTLVIGAYNPAFTAISQYVSYSLHRSADFQRLDAEARGTLQGIEDRASKFSEQMAQHEENAGSVLDQIRNVAAEEGVTQQATYFKQECEHHLTMAGEWRTLTLRWAGGVGAFAIFSLFIHKIPGLVPVTTYDAVQLSISKVLIFSILSYMLLLSSKNFLNHKHNAIVNRHRQNALLTHKALVEASGEAGVRDAVLIQAASCIFSPQSTGYAASSSAGDTSAPKSVVEILSKASGQVLKDS